MQLTYCQVVGGNFGDDLNQLMWPALFPDLPTIGLNVALYGIGTILGGRHDRAPHKVVLGSGLGGQRVARLRGSWDFRWVRGPFSARRLGLDPARALGDPASLWPGLDAPLRQAGPCGLMPHHATWDSFDWPAVAAQAGMRAINPKQSPAEVVQQLQQCSSLLSESLHGAIFADAMGLPWAACVLSHRFNDFKWRDWLATIERPLQPFVADRPLVRSLPRHKAMANRLARWTGYMQTTRRPQLRALGPSPASDAAIVSEALATYAHCEANFACSAAPRVEQQRERMLQACDQFAREYGLRFRA